MVGGVDDQRVAVQAGVAEVVEQPADALVDRGDGGDVVVDEPLVLPPGQVVPGQVGVAEGLVAGGVVGVPRLPLLGRQRPRGGQLQVGVGEDGGDRLLLLVLGLAPARQVVEQRRRGGERHAVVQGEVGQRRFPTAVRGLVADHQHERLGRVAAVPEPAEGVVGDDVGDVPRLGDLAVGGEEPQVVIPALAGQHFPVVEPGRPADQVPLADDGRLVAGRLEQFGERRLAAVEDVLLVGVEAVDVAVGAGEDGRPGRAAEGVGGQAAVEPHAAGGDAVDVRRPVDDRPVGPDGLVAVVVAEDEQDVRPGRGGRWQRGRQRGRWGSAGNRHRHQAPKGDQGTAERVGHRERPNDTGPRFAIPT